MARNSDDEKWVHGSTENEVEEDEEALSLCDLPINGEDNQSRKEAAQSIKKTGEDFDFGSWGGSVFTEPEMCSADELFFQGQILPLRRHSVSSDSGLAVFPIHSRNSSRCTISRSESGGFTSVSSRSSSIRSQHSSSSGSSTVAAAAAATTCRQRVRNQFHSHPSPTPQIRRISSARHGIVSHRSRKSTTWSFFRVGLVQTPGIELKDLKIRSNSTSSTSSGVLYTNKNNSIGDGHNSSNMNGSKIEKKKKERFVDKNGALFAGCKCSIDAVETVPSNEVNAKGGGKEQATTKKKMKQAMTRHRTFEWLKELSLAAVPDET